MQQVTYTHVDGTVTVFTANTATIVMEWDAATQSNVAVTKYELDWGLSTWARERLSSDEFLNFTAASTTWHTDVNLVDENEAFRTYWTSFITDPSVVAKE